MQKYLSGRQPVIATLYGILAGILFAFSAYIPQSGIFLLFLPVIPLALASLHYSLRTGFLSFIAAPLTIAVFLDSTDALFFAILVELPLLHLLRKLLLWRGDGQSREWYPVLPAIAELTLIVAIVFMTVALLVTSDHATQLSQVVGHALADQMKNPDTDIEHYMQLIAQQWSFLIFVMAGWIWILLIYGFTVAANRLLVAKHLALRPDLAITTLAIPLWLPCILLVTAALAVFGTGNDQFAGKTLFLLLLLPYLLSGIAVVHRFFHRAPNRELWLAAFYILLLSMPFLALLLIISGFYHSWGAKAS